MFMIQTMQVHKFFFSFSSSLKLCGDPKFQDHFKLGRIWYRAYLHLSNFSCCYHKLSSSYHLLLGTPTKVKFYIRSCWTHDCFAFSSIMVNYFHLFKSNLTLSTNNSKKYCCYLLANKT